MVISTSHFRLLRQNLFALFLLSTCLIYLSAASPPPFISPNLFTPAQRPFLFIPNVGQSDTAVSFQAHPPGGNLFFTRRGILLALPEAQLRLQFENPNVNLEMIGVEQQPGRVNYLKGNDPANWFTHLPTYGRLSYHQLYPGIDWQVSGNIGVMKGTYYLLPQADATQIRWQYAGANSLTLDPTTGDLLITVAGKTAVSPPTIFVEKAPIAWQEIAGKRVTVPVQYQLDETNGRSPTISFHFPASYNHSYPLVIDPVLTYSTYLGGSGGDFGFAITLDSYSNAYVTGYTYSADFPTASPQQPDIGGSLDAFVSKFSPDGSTLLYSTYLGGSGDDYGYGITTDGLGNAYLTGQTLSTNFPTVTPYQATNGGGQDVFALKLTESGSELLFSTYLGGSAEDVGTSIAVDGTGNVYLTGWTRSLNFPTAVPFDGTLGGPFDAFVTKLSSSGSSLVYSTYLGGNSCCAGTDGTDTGSTIALDSDGNAYVTGFTNSTNFPLANPWQTDCVVVGTCADVFVTKFNAAGSDLLFSTYLGGNGRDEGTGLAVDAAQNIYVTGFTASTTFPTANPAQSSNGGGDDAFISKFHSDGETLLYSTYLGGSGDESGHGANRDAGFLALDALGNAYVVGSTLSGDFPLVSPLPDAHGSASEVYLTKLSADGDTLVYSTYLGGSEADKGQSIAVDAGCDVFLTGYTDSDDFPTAVPLIPEPPNEFLQDAFVSKISEVCGELPTGGISGHVSTPEGTPRPGVFVQAFRFNGFTWDFITVGTTDGSGDYVLDDLIIGTYHLFFLDPFGADEWYDDVTAFDAATDLVVTADTVTPDIDAILGTPDAPMVIVTGTGLITIGVNPDGTFDVSAQVMDSLSVTATVVCEDGDPPESMNLVVGSTAFPMIPAPIGSGTFTVDILLTGAMFPPGSIFDLTLAWVCDGLVFEQFIGTLTMRAAWDPSGQITDANTGQPVVGAVVLLHYVPGWLPRESPADVRPQTCESNLSKPPDAPWSQPAPTQFGVPVNPEVDEANGFPMIDPPANPQYTNQNGRYAWDVVTGCWYVVVFAQGYETLVSPVVGVPPEVTDLDLVLTPLPQSNLFLPLVIRP